VFPLIIGDSVGIAIVSFALNISMAKLFAKKHKYHIRPNQVEKQKQTNLGFNLFV
jgi:hypothetical protein